jgi:hypothetical protein
MMGLKAAGPEIGPLLPSGPESTSFEGLGDFASSIVTDVNLRRAELELCRGHAELLES